LTGAHCQSFPGVARVLRRFALNFQAQLDGFANPSHQFVQRMRLRVAALESRHRGDFESTAKDLQQIVKTKKTELLFLALFLRLLQPGGRAAIIVPDGVLFGSSKAHKTLRRLLVEEMKLDAIVSMPSGVFKPYAGVSTAILLFTKTNSGGTDQVWFYDMQADGFSLDDKRTPQPEKSDLADILARWKNRETEGKRARTGQSFLVPKSESRTTTTTSPLTATRKSCTKRSSTTRPR